MNVINSFSVEIVSMEVTQLFCPSALPSVCDTLGIGLVLNHVLLDPVCVCACVYVHSGVCVGRAWVCTRVFAPHAHVHDVRAFKSTYATQRYHHVVSRARTGSHTDK